MPDIPEGRKKTWDIENRWQLQVVVSVVRGCNEGCKEDCDCIMMMLTIIPLWYLSVKTVTNFDPRWTGVTQSSNNTNPSLGHKLRNVSIQLTRRKMIYKVIEIKVEISEIKFIKYKNITIWNDYYQCLKYDKNLGLREYQCKETTLWLIRLNL